MEIMKENEEKVLFVNGGHVHFLDFRIEDSGSGTDAFYALFASPGVSPEYGNNPGFAVMSVSDYHVHSLDVEWFNL